MQNPQMEQELQQLGYRINGVTFTLRQTLTKYFLITY
jgi:hypothetical protein